MNLFPKQKTPYFIWSPPYTHTSSGVITLHLLCHLLNEMGERAYLVPNDYTGYVVNPELNTPIIPTYHSNFYENNFIAVYSDLVRGNPFNAKHVVRMLLAPRGAYGGDSAFPDTDQVWGALPSLADNVLRIPVCDTDIFYQPRTLNGTLRVGSCFYSRKYEMHGNQLLHELTNNSTRLQGSPEQIADTLRKSTVCYLYEMTGVITEAALCGCPVVLIRTPYFNMMDAQAMMGQVSWSDGELVKECNSYQPEYRKFINDVPHQVREFIHKTKELL